MKAAALEVQFSVEIITWVFISEDLLKGSVLTASTQMSVLCCIETRRIVDRSYSGYRGEKKWPRYPHGHRVMDVGVGQVNTAGQHKVEDQIPCQRRVSIWWRRESVQGRIH